MLSLLYISFQDACALRLVESDYLEDVRSIDPTIRSPPHNRDLCYDKASQRLDDGSSTVVQLVRICAWDGSYSLP